MSEVSLELFKKHVRADDFAGDDEYLEHLLATAEEAVLTATNRTADELRNSETGKLPAPLIHAMMLLAGHWYNQREAVSAVQMHEVPDTLQALVKPFVRLVAEKETITDDPTHDDAGGEDEIQD